MLTGRHSWLYYWIFPGGYRGQLAKTRNSILPLSPQRTRFGALEVLGRDADRELIRTLARRLAEDDPEASRLRAAMCQSVADGPRKKGGILAALRRSPLVGADLDLTRSHQDGRKVEI